MSKRELLDVEIVDEFMRTVPVDVRTLAAKLGLKIVEEELPTDISGKIERDARDSKKFVITVSRLHRETRKRFTIAHEIAHYVLHRERIGEGVTEDARYRNSQLSTGIERQANRYAADMLMPWKAVVRDEAFASKDADALAKKFNVSSAVAAIRIEELWKSGETGIRVASDENSSPRASGQSSGSGAAR